MLLGVRRWNDDVEGDEGKEKKKNTSRYFHREETKRLVMGVGRNGKEESFRNVGMVEVQRERLSAETE